MSYYSLPSILSESQKLPCTFNLTVPGLGYLENPSNPHHHTTHPNPNTTNNPSSTSLSKNSKLELPLWLSIMLAVSNSNTPSANPMVTLDFPAPLQQRVINALKADPKSVDLRAQSAHFYGVGGKVLELFEDEVLVDVLLETFKKRASEIADHAHNPRGALGEGAEFLRGLDETERQLFKAAHEGPKAVRQWVLSLKKQS